MSSADLTSVGAIADRVHQGYPERPEVFANRLALFPDGCLIAEIDGTILGYGIAHPGVIGVPPPLDTVLPTLPPRADCLYIHDICLLPVARGRHLGETVAAHLRQVALAHHLPYLTLTAVNHSGGFWQAQGYADAPCAKLASYGDNARYMIRTV